MDETNFLIEPTIGIFNSEKNQINIIHYLL